MRKIILLLVVFLLTGCSVTYNLEISDVIKENVTATDTGDNNYDLYEMFYEKPIPLSREIDILPESNVKLDGVSYYDMKQIDDYEKFGLNYTGIFNDKIKLSDSHILFYGLGNFDYREEEDGIYINVPSKIKIFEQFSNLDEINVNIKTDYNVIENNADKVNKNVYVWKINRDNYKNKTIKLKISKSSKLEEITEQDSMVTFSICLFILILFGFIIFLFVRMRFRKNNSL